MPQKPTQKNPPENPPEVLKISIFLNFLNANYTKNSQNTQKSSKKAFKYAKKHENWAGFNVSDADVLGSSPSGYTNRAPPRLGWRSFALLRVRKLQIKFHIQKVDVLFDRFRNVIACIFAHLRAVARHAVGRHRLARARNAPSCHDNAFVSFRD